jgi:hypothetical protein
MGYDRYDTRDDPRGERSRWHEDRPENRSSSGRHSSDEDRGFFERASDEIASWFGDDDAERRRHQDEQRDRSPSSWSGRERERDSDRGPTGHARDWERDRSMSSRDRDQGFHDRGWERGPERGETRGYSASERDYNPQWRQEMTQRRERDDRNWGERGENRGGGYRPMTGDYGRSERGMRDQNRSQSQWERDPYRRTSRAGTADKSDRSRDADPHYRSWREQHMSELDRDYDDYRREHQSRFESDFTSWREKRMQKRGLLGQIRQEMDVVGNDGEHVGKVDRIAGDRIILVKSGPDSGGAHHSLACSDIDRVEGDKVILDRPASEAKQQWRDDSRDRALFEREDSGEMGPHVLDRSFEGTYR